MFRKTIIRLAYSPSLAGELTDYARRLRREEAKRQIGLIFIALTLVVQTFAALSPPESANAGNTADFIDGGFNTAGEYLGYYDRDTHDIKDLFTSLGISRDDIQSTRPARLESTPGLLLWKMTSRGNNDDTAYSFIRNDGTTKTVYYQPLPSVEKPSSGRPMTALVGSSSSLGWFALLSDSGNLVTKSSLPGTCDLGDSALPASIPVPVLLQDSERCGVKLESTISARNLTAGNLATSQDSDASDRIIYTLTVTNNDTRTVSVPFSVGITDILDYAELMDRGGGRFDQETETLTWTGGTILSGSSLTRKFIVKLLPTIPSTATGLTDPSSYDCIMSTSFGQTSRIPVACPFSKTIERTVNDLPSLSARTNLLFIAAVFAVSAYFYIRSRQLRTELRLIRHNHQGSL